jgi:hypothetical protein
MIMRIFIFDTAAINPLRVAIAGSLTQQRSMVDISHAHNAAVQHLKMCML